jgi:hypothetical protein
VKRMLLLLVVSALVVAMMAVGAGPASAQGPPEPVAHPFCTSGEDFAHGHVVALAQDPAPGPQIAAPQAGGVHNPGVEHQGFAVCDPPTDEPAG